MMTPAQELEHKTQLYWRMSQTFRGRSKERFTIKDGLEITRNTLQHLDPVHPLWKHYALFQRDIIQQRHYA